MTPEAIASTQFREIAETHGLRCEFEPAPVEVYCRIPAQPGLAFEIVLMLQNVDEWHLSAGAFQMPYFPCTDAAVAESFRAAAGGLIDGTYRLVEWHWVGLGPYKICLQAWEGNIWKTLATHRLSLTSLIALLLPAWKHSRIIRNASE